MNEYEFRHLPTASLPTSSASVDERGSKDGEGAGDHDEPFAGFRAYRFSTHQRVRLILIRGDLLEARLGRANMAASDLTGSDTTCLRSERAQAFLTDF